MGFSGHCRVRRVWGSKADLTYGGQLAGLKYQLEVPPTRSAVTVRIGLSLSDVLVARQDFSSGLCLVLLEAKHFGLMTKAEANAKYTGPPIKCIW